MIFPRVREQEWFSEYVRLLLSLHELIAEGRGDTEEADEIRDRMDYPWKHLSTEQLKLVDGLSTDLYTIGEDRVTTRSAPEIAGFKQAVEHSDWPRSLALIRENESQLEPRATAFLRAVCWAHLNCPDAALTFFAEVARLSPLEPGEEVWQLMCYQMAGRSSERTTRVREIVTDANDPRLVLAAAHVLFDASVGGTADVEHEAITAAQRGLAMAKAQQESQQETDPELVSLQRGVLLHLALSYAELDDRPRALAACTDALKLAPDDLDALMLLGLLNYDETQLPQRESLRLEVRRHISTSEPALPGTLLN